MISLQSERVQVEVTYTACIKAKAYTVIFDNIPE